MEVENYILCLDTDKYAGNFERETTGYCTGRYGECGVGESEADDFNEAEMPDGVHDEMDDKVLSVNDEHGCSRPCAIQPTPGWVNDGHGTHAREEKPTGGYPAYNTVGIFLEEPLSDDALKMVVSRAKEYLTRINVKLERVRLVTNYVETKSEVLNVL